MSISGSSIDGLISGLNTTDIVNAAIAAAAAPQTALKARVSQQKTMLAAYQAINTKVAALQTAADAVASRATWSTMTATSSDSSVAATASAGAQQGTFLFDVTQIARGQSSVFSGTVNGTAAQVVTSGTPVTVTKTDGTVVTIDTGDGSLASLVAGFNSNADAGVKAVAVQVSPGNYKLQLNSATTGEAASFTISGLDALGSQLDTQTAQDAEITVGAGSPGQYTITSSTNTFDGALPGVTFTVSKQATGVALSTSIDADGIADKVKAMVDAANAALSQITVASSYDSSTSTASPLTGDFTVRQLQQNILSAVSAGLPNGQAASSLGIDLTRDGSLTFDRDAFLNAYNADPAGTQAALGAGGGFTPSGSTTGSITFATSSDATRAGSYDVVVTQAASRAYATLDLSGGLSAGQTITFDAGSSAVTYTVDAGDTQATLVDKLNALAASSGLGIVASDDGSGTIKLERTAYGAGPTMHLSATGGLNASAVTAGTDVAGTIGGHAAKGSGQILFTDPGTPGVDAVSLTVTLDAADVAGLGGASAGSFKYSPGLAQSLATVAWSATDSTAGSITAAIDAANATIKDMNDRISSMDVLLDQKRASIKQMYDAMETQLGQMKTQSQWLTSQLSGLLTNYSGTSKS